MIKAFSFLRCITGFVLLSFLNSQEISTKRCLLLSSKRMIHNSYYWVKKDQYTAMTNYYSAETNTPKNNSDPDKLYQVPITSFQDSDSSHYETLILNNSIFFFLLNIAIYQPTDFCIFKYFEYNQ